MSAVALAFPLDAAYLDADWDQQFLAYLDDELTPQDLTGVTAKIKFTQRAASGAPHSFELTTDANGGVEIIAASGEINIHVAKAAIAGLGIVADNYAFEVRLFWFDGRIDALLTGTMPFRAGLST